MGESLRGLLDTSVVIATGVEELPDESAISVATLAELHFGVHVARSDKIRRARLQRLGEIESRLQALPVDDAVGRAYGALAHMVITAGRQPRTRVMDILIAATAKVHEAPLYTHNANDFDVFEEILEIRRV